MQMNIPWSHILPGGPDELPFIINLIDGQPYACSHECMQATQFDGLSCRACAGLAPKVLELGTTLMTYKARTRRSLLGVVQLHRVLDDRHAELNKWKFKVMSRSPLTQTCNILI